MEHVSRTPHHPIRHSPTGGYLKKTTTPSLHQVKVFPSPAGPHAHPRVWGKTQALEGFKSNFSSSDLGQMPSCLWASGLISAVPGTQGWGGLSGSWKRLQS